MTTIHRATHDKEHPFVMIARGVAQCKAISYEALGLLTYLLSKPDDWKIVPEDLSREACGKNRVYKLLKELKDAGYIDQERGQAAHDKPPMWGERVVYEEPNPTIRDIAPNPSIHNHETPYMANAIYGETPLTKQEIKDNKQEIKQNTQSARVPARKGFESVPKQDRLEIIRAWADNLPITPVNVYNRDAYHSAAADIFEAGYRAPQVALFVKAKMSDPFWYGKTLTLAKVGELMPMFLLDYGKPPPAFNGNGNGNHARAAPPPPVNGKQTGNDGVLGLMQAAKGAK